MNKDKSYKTFDQIIPDYLKEKNIVLKPKTFIGHRGKTLLFGKWLGWNGLNKLPLRKIKNRHIRDFSVYLAETRDLDRATCEKYRDTLRVFFRYVKIVGQTKKIPFKRFILPLKKRDNKPAYIPADKIVALLNEIRVKDPQLFVGCMIQYCSAIRPGKEMLNLKPGVFNFGAKTIQVGELNAKTGKQRYADLTDELIEYLIEYGVQQADSDCYLFGKHRTFGLVHICENNLTVRFNKYRDSHQISKKVKFYSWKHTGLTDLIASKLCSLPQLQHHAGHDNIRSTEKYILEHGGLTNDIIKTQFRSPMIKDVA